MVESTTTDSLTIIRPRAEKVFVRNLALLEQPPREPARRRRVIGLLPARVVLVARVARRSRPAADSD